MPKTLIQIMELDPRYKAFQNEGKEWLKYYNENLNNYIEMMEEALDEPEKAILIEYNAKISFIKEFFDLK